MSKLGDFKNVYYIREPFWTAGRKFDWIPLHKMPGIGLAVEKLRGSEPLYVRIKENDEAKGKIYSIDKAKAKDFATEYKTLFMARGTPLVVIPWDMFDIAYEPPFKEPPKPRKPRKQKYFIPIVKIKAEEKQINMSLF